MLEKKTEFIIKKPNEICNNTTGNTICLIPSKKIPYASSMGMLGINNERYSLPEVLSEVFFDMNAE